MAMITFPALNVGDSRRFAIHDQGQYSINREWNGQMIAHYGVTVYSPGYDGAYVNPSFVTMKDATLFLRSLTAWLGSEADHGNEVRECMQYAFRPCALSREVWQFAEKIKYDETRFHNYFTLGENRRECKMSRVESKQYDKRWTRVEPSHDGKFSSAYNIVCSSRSFGDPTGVLDLLALLETLYNACDVSSTTLSLHLGELGYESLVDPKDDWDTIYSLLEGFRRIMEVAKAYTVIGRLRYPAKRVMERFAYAASDADVVANAAE